MEIWTETQGDEGHVKKEAGPGVMRPQAKGCLRPPEAGGVQGRILPERLSGECGSADALILNFEPPEP